MSRFAREHVGKVWDELTPLMIANHAEAALTPKLNPKRAMFEMLEGAGVLRMFVSRGTDGSINGFATFIVVEHMILSATVAVQQAIYVKPECRGSLSGRFLKWMDEQLAAESVDQIQRSVRWEDQKFAFALDKMGYSHDETVFIRRF